MKLNFKDLLTDIQKNPQHQQYHEIVMKMISQVMKQITPSEPVITHNIRNTHGTGVDGIQETIDRLIADGFFVEKFQEMTVPYCGLDMITYASVKVSTIPLTANINVGSFTDPLLNETV